MLQFSKQGLGPKYQVTNKMVVTKNIIRYIIVKYHFFADLFFLYSFV